MNQRGEQVHGIAILDGDASGGIETLLFISGSLTARTLAATEFLHITDVDIVSEDGGNIYYDCDSDGDDDHDAGDIVIAANVAANGGVARNYTTPHVCPVGKKPKLYGSVTNLDVAIIHGFITRA